MLNPTRPVHADPARQFLGFSYTKSTRRDRRRPQAQARGDKGERGSLAPHFVDGDVASERGISILSGVFLPNKIQQHQMVVRAAGDTLVIGDKRGRHRLCVEITCS